MGNGLGANELLHCELSADKVKPNSLSPLSHRSDGFSGARLGYMGTVQEVSITNTPSLFRLYLICTLIYARKSKISSGAM